MIEVIGHFFIRMLQKLFSGLFLALSRVSHAFGLVCRHLLPTYPFAIFGELRPVPAVLLASAGMTIIQDTEAYLLSVSSYSLHFPLVFHHVTHTPFCHFDTLLSFNTENRLFTTGEKPGGKERTHFRHFLAYLIVI